MLKGLSQFRDGHSVRLGYVHSASNACSSGAAPSPVDVPVCPPKSWSRQAVTAVPHSEHCVAAPVLGSCQLPDARDVG
jgi:hypothetical protein